MSTTTRILLDFEGDRRDVHAYEQSGGYASLRKALAMEPGIEYASENYRWFAKRGRDFLYVDRIVIGAESRGVGIGRLLYGAAFAKAEAEGRAEVDCEVNLRPPNPKSLGFHRSLGFRPVGEQETKGGAVRVALLAAAVDGG